MNFSGCRDAYWRLVVERLVSCRSYAARSTVRRYAPLLPFLPMRFYLPRRHRRKLLFPPGLLALGWLLWLGCVALAEHPEQLRRRSIMQLTMPIRPQTDPLHPTIRWVVPNPDTLLTRDSWREATLTGNVIHDSFQQQQIIKQLRAIVADTMCAGGLRVKLEPTAQYASMVFLLDLMLRENMNYYWFDITRRPTTFYAIRKATAGSNQNPLFNCGNGNGVICAVHVQKPSPFWVRFDNWVTEFWQLKWLMYPCSLLQPEWRASLWLLTLIAVLGFWRVIRAWRMA